MFWLVIGIIGAVVYLVGMFLVTVWMGGASYMDALIVFLSTIAIVVFIGLTVFALMTGIGQVFG